MSQCWRREGKRKTDHISLLFQPLQWLPIQQRIQYKINTLCYECITRTAPSYVCDCLHLCTPSCTLRSASDTLSLQIPRTRLSTVGSRAFSVLGPSTWNDLPCRRALRHKPSLNYFLQIRTSRNNFPLKQSIGHVFRSTLVSSSAWIICLLSI